MDSHQNHFQHMPHLYKTTYQINLFIRNQYKWWNLNREGLTYKVITINNPHWVGYHYQITIYLYWENIGLEPCSFMEHIFNAVKINKRKISMTHLFKVYKIFTTCSWQAEFPYIITSTYKKKNCKWNSK